MDGLKKFLRMCKKSGFFSAQISENSLESIQYGPLGSLLRRNVWREWLSSNINNSDVYMFPLDTKNELVQCQSEDKTEYPLMLDVLRNYSQVMPFIGTDKPFGFAAYGSSMLFKKRKTEILFADSFLSKLDYRHWLCVAFFCSPKKACNWFNYWSRHRYRWWRKFSSIPSQFCMSDVSEMEAGDQEISLMMECPWGKEKLETVTLHKVNPWCESSLIVCQTELDLGAIAFLCNSLDDKWQENGTRNLLQLHVKLAPYKVCISMDGKDSLQEKKLMDVASRLAKELKKCQVALFPYMGSSYHSQWSRLDEMGIPYTIVLNKRTLQTGVAGLRSRDTSLEEQIHIAELTPKLLTYLQMKSYHDEEY